ncbi:DUF3850 domain-containing protein [Clostridium sp. ZC22-4]|uniref:DUF3850 domain-containing protein n=1 Tax=Clostridium brassicae TaxID=2999072 RepID=A0ABT4DA83_9CLOT|nr:DUF3850 domain-containing protein [Clostridium brassicae]
MNHQLKIIPKYFNDVANKTKTFEVRKDDRNFQVGDCLVLREFENGDYTGKYISVYISYILGREYNEKKYVKDGYVILGIK